MGGWAEFVGAFFVFFASHRLLATPRIKAPLSARLGAGGFSALYSAISVLALTWIIVAAGRAPYVELWQPRPWMKHAALGLMALATLIFALALGRPNPLSFGGLGDTRFEPSRPGLIGWMRHPLLAVLAIWSLAHILPNGDLAHVLMFGLFLVFATVGTRIIDRRRQRQMGVEEWRRLAGQAAANRRLEVTRSGLVRLLAGLALYAALLWLHQPVIGVDPLG